MERPLPARSLRRQAGFSPDVIAQVSIEAKYNGYIGRQIEQIERFRRLEDKPIPADLDYRSIAQLRAEAVRSLTASGRYHSVRPGESAGSIRPTSPPCSFISNAATRRCQFRSQTSD